MITVENARVLVKEFEDNKKNELAQKIQNFCDTVVSPAIEENAKMGKRFATVEVDPNHTYDVLAELKKQSWNCFLYGANKIEIVW